MQFTLINIMFAQQLFDPSVFAVYSSSSCHAHIFIHLDPRNLLIGIIQF